MALGLPGVDVHEVVQVHRRYLVELMQQWTRLKEDESRFDLDFALVVDAELFRLDSLIRWLDMADGRLKRAAADASGAGTAVVPPPQGPAQGGNEAMSYLELRGISKIYGEGATEVHALADIELSVDAGSLVAVMGASGSGKSTLLTIAGSLEEPTQRRGLRRRRRRCRRCRATARPACAGSSIGYVFQDFNLLAGPHRGGERVAAPGARRRRGPEGAGRGAWSRSRSSAWPTGPRTFPDELSGRRAPAGRHRAGRRR